MEEAHITVTRLITAMEAQAVQEEAHRLIAHHSERAAEQGQLGKALTEATEAAATMEAEAEAQAVQDSVKPHSQTAGLAGHLEYLAQHITLAQEAEAQATAQMEATAELAAEAQAHPIIVMLQLAEPAG